MRKIKISYFATVDDKTARKLKKLPAVQTGLLAEFPELTGAMVVEEGNGAKLAKDGSCYCCPSCFGAVSPYAKYCEHCGTMVDQTKRRKIV